MLPLLQAVLFSTVVGIRGTWVLEPTKPTRSAPPPAWTQLEGSRNEFGVLERRGR